MGLYDALKQTVPLRWRVAFHRHKTWPLDLTVRVGNRLKGELPLPPAKLIFLVTGDESPRWFLDSGRSASQDIRKVLANHRLRMEQFTAVLDFGCGAGRILRHWRSTQGPAWHGTDYNPQLVDWCRDNLTFSRFSVNSLSGKLPYESGTFDFIYAYSVFTHLSEELQFFWIDELSRVLKPGGYLYFTTHGEYYLQGLTTAEREQFQEGLPVFRQPHDSGKNLCAVFHPPQYVQRTMAQAFTVLDFVPGGGQDIHFMRKG